MPATYTYLPWLLSSTQEGAQGGAPSDIQLVPVAQCRWCKFLVLEFYFYGIPRKPSYSASFSPLIFQSLSILNKFFPRTPILSPPLNYPGSTRAGPHQETVTDFIFLGYKITVDCDCNHEIKRCLLLGRKVMTNVDSMLKSRDILPTKVCIVKAMVFPVVMYGCEELNHKQG